MESNKRKKKSVISAKYISFILSLFFLTFCDINLQTTTMPQFRHLLKQMWFSNSHGFKHVFIGELTSQKYYSMVSFKALRLKTLLESYSIPVL